MEDIYQDTDICYVTRQMARRIFFQLRIMDELKKGTSAYETMIEAGHRDLPGEWLKLSDEWCKDHHIGREHGIMALLYLKSIFGMDFEDVLLRVILDDAFEESKNIELVRE